MPLTKTLEHCFKHGLLYKGGIDNKLQLVKLGSTGALLRENLHNEWFHNIIINRDCSVFYNTSSFQETFNYAKEISSHYLPFGVAEILNDEKNLDNFQADTPVHNVKLMNNATLKCTMFVSPSEATQYFHQWQRQRRIWWRKVRFKNLK